MPLFDLPAEDLRAYRPSVREHDDFDEFWEQTLTEARRHDEAPVVTPAVSPLTEVDAFDVTFPGFGGDPITGWLLLPRARTGPLPTVIQYNGYGRGRGFPHEHLAWPASGYALLVMDTRGQGSAVGSGGDTADPHGAAPAAPGFMTRGILNPRDYYFRRLFTDAVRAVDAMRGLDMVDENRIAVCGASQGGGIALAVAGLVPDLLGAMPDVPFLCDFARGATIAQEAPFTEITRYLSVHRDHVDRVFDTLSYFDGVNFARRAACPALFSVALMDPVVPPSTVFAAINHYRGEAAVEEYPFNEHEGGAGHHWVKQAAWLARLAAGELG